jgi:hypothetical protein
MGFHRVTLQHCTSGKQLLGSCPAVTPMSFQPIDLGKTEEAYRRNRRIEFKLTER